MRPIIFNTRFLLGKAVLLSFLFHWAIFNNFILVFPILAEAHKPTFVFLGSILQASDMVNEPRPEKVETNYFKNLDKVKSRGDLFSGAIDKPSPLINHDPRSKRTHKHVEDQNVPKEPVLDPLANEDFTIEKKVEPYKPLRLKEHDQD